MTPPIIELPCFDEESDTIDSYLVDFEQVASYEGWEIASYPILLSILLTGKARDVYCRIPLALANDYRYRKEALLAINYERVHKYVGYEEAQPLSNQGGMRKCSDIPRYRHPQSNRHSFFAI